jgi:hypothetical protein
MYNGIAADRHLTPLITDAGLRFSFLKFIANFTEMTCNEPKQFKTFEGRRFV